MLRTSFLVVPALLASTGMAQVTLTPLPVVEGETAVTGDGTLDISADGTLAIGLVSTPGGTPYAVVWRKLQGQWRRATLPALPCMVFGDVALSADGDSAVGGKCFSSQSAYIWTNLRSGFPTLLEVPFGSEYIAPRAVSNGASVLTGQSFNTGFLRSNGTVSTLTPRPEHALSIGVAMSADGSVILGLSWTWPDFGSNLWNSSNQIIATFAANHTPGALTSDGLTAVGYIATTPGEDGGDVPAYWQNGVVATQFPAPQGFPPQFFNQGIRAFDASLNAAVAVGLGRRIDTTVFPTRYESANLLWRNGVGSDLGTALTQAGIPTTNIRFAPFARVSDTDEIIISALTGTSNLATPFVIDFSDTTTASGCDSIDFNGNGVFPEDQDVIDFFNVLAGAPCPTGLCNDIDFNNNNVFPEDQDVIDFFNVLAGGTC